TGYDFEHPTDPLAHKRIEDTHHVISLSFSNLGGADAVMAYFKANGKRSYEASVYGNLGEHYLEKRRYNDAAVTYRSFVTQNPYHRLAPHYDTRVIDIYKKGGFPKLVIDANKAFVVSYGLKSPYWEHFDIQAHPDVVGYVKTSLKELASHYHALYQEKKFEKEQPANFTEAMRWYREFLASFPKEAESPALHFQMASLLLENKTVGQAAIEFERTAYDYPAHEQAAEAGYAAVYAHRLHLASAATADQAPVKQDIIRSSLKFAETFPQHEKAPLVMSAALDDLYAMKDYRQAVTSSRRLIALFPAAEQPIRRTAWLILAHASFELAHYREAEEGYLEVLPLTAQGDPSRPELVENLAASIYQQGDEANKKADYRTAAGHFLRVARAAPTSTILPTAEYDGATALIQLKDWGPAAEVLRAFRSHFPSHKLQPEVTKKLAHVYREDGKLSQAAVEYERIETETRDPELRSAALMMAGDLYLEAREEDKALAVYRRYLTAFPRPLEVALESRQKIAGILKGRGDTAAYQAELRTIVQADASAGRERTDRTRYLGATSLLVLTEPLYERYAQIRLRKPFEDNLKKKQAALREVRTAMEKILDYEISETSAAATYYLGETYLEFSRALNESERPEDLQGEEKEQYELALEEQAYPFEERAISVHKKN
ncbi:MAG: tetratricopeptide repeat protein, partial [Curvibacter sp.]